MIILLLLFILFIFLFKWVLEVFLEGIAFIIVVIGAITKLFVAVYRKYKK